MCRNPLESELLTMNTTEMREQASIRYSKELYLGYGRSRTYHFFYAYKRFLLEYIRVIRAFPSCLTARARLDSDTVAVYATRNQRIAIDAMARTFDESFAIVYLYQISLAHLIARFGVWILKALLYPFAFVFCRQVEGLYWVFIFSGMKFYNLILIKSLKRAGVRRLIVSNDHSGDIFILTMLLRGDSSISLEYVQHGAVKDSFPKNEFSKLYLRDAYSEEVYRKLSLKQNVEFIQCDFNGDRLSKQSENFDVLVCFSHQFYPVATYKLLAFLGERYKDGSIYVRFHPSDKLASFKFFMARFLFKINLSNTEDSFLVECKRAKTVVSASSSILLDMYKLGLSEKLAWYKPIGLSWDYYDLVGKIQSFSDLNGLGAWIEERIDNK